MTAQHEVRGLFFGVQTMRVALARLRRNRKQWTSKRCRSAACVGLTPGRSVVVLSFTLGNN